MQLRPLEVEYLCRARHDNLSNSSPRVLERIRRITGQAPPFYRADIRDESAVRDVVSREQPGAVLHFAGLKAVGESVEQPERYQDNNVNGTRSLLDVMAEAGLRRIVFSSSATVYGEPVYLPFDEAHPCQPTNVYGRTKHFAEEILRDWQRATPGSAVTLLMRRSYLAFFEDSETGRRAT